MTRRKLRFDSQIIKSGGTRYVWLIGRYAIKIPSLFNWGSFLNGLLANMQEHRFGKMNNPSLAKVHISSSLGLFVIMERVQPIRHRGLFFIELKRLVLLSKDLPADFLLRDGGVRNFGYNSECKLVKLDYGN